MNLGYAFKMNATHFKRKYRLLAVLWICFILSFCNFVHFIPYFPFCPHCPFHPLHFALMNWNVSILFSRWKWIFTICKAGTFFNRFFAILRIFVFSVLKWSFACDTFNLKKVKDIFHIMSKTLQKKKRSQKKITSFFLRIFNFFRNNFFIFSHIS